MGIKEDTERKKDQPDKAAVKLMKEVNIFNMKNNLKYNRTCQVLSRIYKNVMVIGAGLCNF